jgi:hypothetical protein
MTPTENFDASRVNGQTINKINDSIRKDFVEKMRLRDNQINDYCFVLNYPSLVQKDNPSSADNRSYYGLVSLCSTTISQF